MDKGNADSGNEISSSQVVFQLLAIVKNKNKNKNKQTNKKNVEGPVKRVEASLGLLGV